jgi:hypothetical protein
MSLGPQAEADYSKKDRSNRIVIASILSYCGIILFLSTLSAFVFSAFPLKITDPAWQLRIVAGILGSCVNILLSGIIFLISEALSKRNVKKFAKYLKFIQFLSIVVILAIPFQIYAGRNAINRQAEPLYKIISDLKGYSNGIRASQNEAQLRGFLASIPDGPTLPDKFNQPYESIKERALTNLQGKINRALNDIESQKSDLTQLFILECVRNSIQSILMFLGLRRILSYAANLRERQRSNIEYPYQ